MQLLHMPDDHNLANALLYLARFALETPSANMRVQFNTISFACTADTLAGQDVTFSKPFASPPVILLSTNPDTPSSLAVPSHDKTKLTAAGFHPQVYTSRTQNVDLTYIAIGQV